MRSINNVVDATNYVMFELNQPMHAYDLATLRGCEARRPPGAGRRAAGDARRRRARAVARDDRHRGCRGGHRVGRRHGRRHHRGGQRDSRRAARGRLLESVPDPARPSHARHDHRGELSVRARHRPVGRDGCDAPLHRDPAGHGRRRDGRGAARPLARTVASARGSFSGPRGSRRCSAWRCPGRLSSSTSSPSARRWSPSRTTAGSRWTYRAGVPTWCARST